LRRACAGSSIRPGPTSPPSRSRKSKTCQNLASSRKFSQSAISLEKNRFGFLEKNRFGFLEKNRFGFLEKNRFGFLSLVPVKFLISFRLLTFGVLSTCELREQEEGYSMNFFTWGFTHDWCITNGHVRVRQSLEPSSLISHP